MMCNGDGMDDSASLGMVFVRRSRAQLTCNNGETVVDKVDGAKVGRRDECRLVREWEGLLYVQQRRLRTKRALGRKICYILPSGRAERSCLRGLQTRQLA